MELRDLAPELAEKAPMGMLLMRLREPACILTINPEGRRLLGLTAAEPEREDGQPEPGFFEELRRKLHAEGAELSGTYRVGERYLFARCRNIGDDRLLAAFTDVTEREAREQAAVRTAREDPLTTLLNRRAFVEEMNERIEARPGRSAFMMLDLDDFKRVNDIRGHLAGDELLVATARKLRSLFRAEDVVGRFGGDEFCVFMTNVPSREHVCARAAHMTERLRYVFRDGGRPVTCSLGIALYPEDGASFPELCQRADSAMYAAKLTGKDRFSFYEP